MDWKSGQFEIGISGHFALEWVANLDWNRWPVWIRFCIPTLAQFSGDVSEHEQEG